MKVPAVSEEEREGEGEEEGGEEEGGGLRAVSSGKPIQPASVEGYLDKAFGGSLEAAKVGGCAEGLAGECLKKGPGHAHRAAAPALPACWACGQRLAVPVGCRGCALGLEGGRRGSAEACAA